jgi:hypothetical protein
MYLPRLVEIIDVFQMNVDRFIIYSFDLGFKENFVINIHSVTLNNKACFKLFKNI